MALGLDRYQIEEIGVLRSFWVLEEQFAHFLQEALH